MAVVLCISSDASLATTRRWILEHAGHRVVAASNVHDVERACMTEPIDVAVIGQGVPRSERQRIRDLVRNRCPTAKLLELYLPGDGKFLKDADDWMELPADPPAELAERVSQLACKRRCATSANE